MSQRETGQVEHEGDPGTGEATAEPEPDAPQVQPLAAAPAPAPEQQATPPQPAAWSNGAAPPEEPPRMESVFEPPRGRLMVAIAHNKLLITVCAILCALIGVALAVARPTSYEAAATLQIGQVNPNSPGFASFTQSSSSLAGAFSRAVAAEPVLKEIERKLGISAERAALRLTSEPIPLSPAFRVIAKGPSAAGAKELADVASRAIIAYENRSNSANPQANDLLKSYRKASLELSRAKEAVATAEKSGSGDGLLQAQARQSAAKVKLKAISAAYVSTVTSQPPRVGFISLLAGAATAKSNRNSRIELYGFIGLLIGLVLGCGAAYLRQRRHDPASAPSASPQAA